MFCILYVLYISIDRYIDTHTHTHTHTHTQAHTHTHTHTHTHLHAEEIDNAEEQSQRCPHHQQVQNLPTTQTPHKMWT